MNWMVSSKFHIWTLWKTWRFHLSKWYTSPLDTLPGRGAQIFHSEYSKLTRIYLKTAKKNAAFVEMVSKLAEKKGITPAQFCIAWVSSLGPHMIPLPGSSWVSLKLIRICFAPDFSSICTNHYSTETQNALQKIRLQATSNLMKKISQPCPSS